MSDSIRTLIRIQILVIVLFVLGKMVLRPAVLSRDAPVWLDVVVLSLPNLFEAIVGTVTVVTLLLIANARLLLPERRFSESKIYRAAIVLVAIYVILQEFKIHNLGGHNVYDPYDVLFSVIGLFISSLMLVRLQPTASNRNTTT